jgi:hypothetical protein
MFIRGGEGYGTLMSSQTITFGGWRVTRLTALGCFAALSFAFASYLYLGGQTVSETLTDADTYSFQGKTNDTVTLQTKKKRGQRE